MLGGAGLGGACKDEAGEPEVMRGIMRLPGPSQL